MASLIDVGKPHIDPPTRPQGTATVNNIVTGLHATIATYVRTYTYVYLAYS